MNNKKIFRNGPELYKAAAENIIAISKKAIGEKGRFTIALSGGNTPRKLYQILAQPPHSNSLDWKNIFVFWGDERCVPQSDENNNSHMAYAALLKHVPVPPENIFPIPVNLTPEAAANSYEQTLITFFKDTLPRFDLILLGLGNDGHTASLFPRTEILKNNTRLVKEVSVNDVHADRISFTARLINHAANILVLVTGKEKAPILKTIFSGSTDTESYPVQLIDLSDGNLEWYLDEDAASSIP